MESAAAHRRPAPTTFLPESHLMWRQIFNSYSQTAPSWDQETAFAEDTAAAAVWPPRSYTCNFCMRQFRSAQALGGHMNVHRRDRARLQNDPSRPFRPPKPCPIVKSATFNGHDDDDFYNCLKNNNKRSKVCVSSFSASSSLDQELDLELRLGF